MSTRSNIVIKVKPADYGTVSNTINAKVDDKTPYIQIYSHNDGYPGHMLDELETYFNDYDSALKMILAGNTSGIYDGGSQTYTCQGESYEDNAPWPVEHPSFDEDYLYVFENDEWTVFNENDID